MASALREELQGVRVMELHARAAAEGVGEALLEDAMDSAEPRAALIELLVVYPMGTYLVKLPFHSLTQTCAAPAARTRRPTLCPPRRRPSSQALRPRRTQRWSRRGLG